MSYPKEFEAFVTQWALTTGVRKMRGVEYVPEHGTRYFQPTRDGAPLIAPKHWHRDEAAAIRAVQAMIVARRRAMLKETDKLEGMLASLANGLLPMAGMTERGRRRGDERRDEVDRR